MNFKFDILFTVEFRHPFFEDGLFQGFTITPSDAAKQQMKRLGLVFKLSPGGFFIGYDTSFAGSARQREDLLKDSTVLIFRLDLLDTGLYSYTGGLPETISGSIFHFHNFTIPPEKKKEFTPGQLRDRDEENWLAELDAPSTLIGRESLLADEFVSEKDIDVRPAFKNNYFAKPFGQLSVLLHNGMENKFVMPFALKSTYWQYILLSKHLQKLANPIVINKTTKRPFHGPVTVTLPENKQGIAFVSDEPIALTNMPNRMFQLVENYESGNDHYKVIIEFLPNPDIRHISVVPAGENTVPGKNYSNIIL